MTGQSPPLPEGPPLEVNVSTVEQLPEFPSTYNTSSSINLYPYTTYKVMSRTSTDYHTLAAPIAGPAYTYSGSSTPSTAVFKLANPTSKVTLTGTAERLGANPQMPLPTTTNPSYVLTRWDVSTGYPAVLDDGVTAITRCDFVIEYILTAPPDPSNPSFIVGVLPWTTIPSSTASFSADDFTDQITGLDNAALA